MPLRAHILRRGGRIKQRERLGGAFALEEIGDEVEPRAGVTRLAREGLPQQCLAGIGLPADAHERAEIRSRCGMAGRAGERLAHRRLGVLDIPLPVARDAVIHPGIGPARCKLDCRAECLLRARRLVQREPRLAVDIVGARLVGRPVAGFARGD
jgi:hypothetical protein